jgi:hypothetical protein
LPHRVYRPDLAPNDFFLFGSLKEKLIAFDFTTRGDLTSVIIIIFDEIDRENLLAVFNSWVERLKRASEHGRQYFKSRKRSSAFPLLSSPKNGQAPGLWTPDPIEL